MLTNSQKEHLTYTLIWQSITLVVLWIWTYSYIIPGVSKIDIAVAWANASVEKYSKTDDKWLSFEEITSTIAQKTEYAELLKIMNTDLENTRKAILKPTWEWKYIDWLKKAIWNSSKDKDILSQQKKILNSIIPTLSPISGNIEEENMDLKGYIRFMESKILKQFNIESNIVLGLQGISLWNKADGIPENIWSFDVQISFKAKNKDISWFVSFINHSGSPALLTDSGIAMSELLPKDKIPIIMSNPLITLTSFNLENAIDPGKPDDDNSWRATLKFYVRWISKDDISYLKENIKNREEELWNRLGKSIIECRGKWALCGETAKRLDEFSRKYQEYKVGSLYSEGWLLWGGDQISIQSQKAKVLKSLEWEFIEIVSEK